MSLFLCNYRGILPSFLLELLRSHLTHESICKLSSILLQMAVPLSQYILLMALSYPVGLRCPNGFSSVQSLSRVWLFATPWIAACQASLSITISRSSLRLTFIESVMASSHLILGRPLLLLPPIPPSIRVFPNESTLRTRWPKYWSFSFSIIPSKAIPGLISFRMDWLDSLQSKGLSRVFSNTTV